MKKTKIQNREEIVFNFFSWKKREITWVMVVLAVILFISWRQLITGEMKTRDAQRKADVELVARALDRYYTDYQIYPPADNEGRIVSCGYVGSNPCIWGEDTIVDEDNVAYLKGVPKDPQNWKQIKYFYTTNEDKSEYKIYVHLEYTGDPAYKKNLTQECGIGVQCNWWVESK